MCHTLGDNTRKFPNKSMLMTGTNNKLRFRNNKTLFNNTSNTKCEKAIF